MSIKLKSRLYEMSTTRNTSILSEENVLDDPRVDKELVLRRWAGEYRMPSRVPRYVKRALVEDLNFLNNTKQVELNCRFYKLGRCKQDTIFHHYAPHWLIEAIDEKTNQSVRLDYTGGKFYNFSPVTVSPNVERENR